MSYIRLNVGGQIFVTSSSTLNKLADSFYHPLGLNYPRDRDGIIMIDRNPKYFGYILDFLRMLGTEQKFHISDTIDRNEFINEIKHFRVQGLLDLFPHMDSAILDENEKRDLCKLCGFASNQEFKLLYRGSRDGFGADVFHRKCDNIPNTLTLIKSTNEYIFGGFIEQTWDHSGNNKSDPNAFLFSLVNYENRPAKISFGSYLARNRYYSHICEYCGPCFGNGDLFIFPNSSRLTLYMHPNNNLESFDKTTFLAGSNQFDIKDIEVFQKT